jgi:hypothetical protein
MAPHLFQPDKPPAVLAAKLGDLGGAIGGALLVAGVGEASRTAEAASAVA